MKSSEAPAAAMTIGAVAARFGLATHVLRHWESTGLLHPGRDTAGRRLYGADDVTQVAVILICKEAGLGLDAIRSLSGTGNRAARFEILRAEAAKLRSRIAAAQASLEFIEGGLNCGHEDVTRCPSFRRLVTERANALKPAP